MILDILCWSGHFLRKDIILLSLPIGLGIAMHLGGEVSSFDEFSIPTGGSAHFDNAVEIDIIFSRVTGGQVSDIDGLLSANGIADLFLMNPQCHCLW